MKPYHVINAALCLAAIVIVDSWIFAGILALELITLHQAKRFLPQDAITFCATCVMGIGTGFLCSPFLHTNISIANTCLWVIMSGVYIITDILPNMKSLED